MLKVWIKHITCSVMRLISSSGAGAELFLWFKLLHFVMETICVAWLEVTRAFTVPWFWNAMTSDGGTNSDKFVAWSSPESFGLMHFEMCLSITNNSSTRAKLSATNLVSLKSFQLQSFTKVEIGLRCVLIKLTGPSWKPGTCFCQCILHSAMEIRQHTKQQRTTSHTTFTEQCGIDLWCDRNRCMDNWCLNDLNCQCGSDWITDKIVCLLALNNRLLDKNLHVHAFSFQARARIDDHRLTCNCLISHSELKIAGVCSCELASCLMSIWCAS